MLGLFTDKTQAEPQNKLLIATPSTRELETQAFVLDALVPNFFTKGFDMNTGKSIFLFGGFAIAAGICGWFLHSPPQSKVSVFEPQFQSGNLPQLEDETQSPYFSRQLKVDGGKKVEEILRFRGDQSVVHLFYGPGGLLCRVEAFRAVGDKELPLYEADYAGDGRRIIKSRYYDANGSLEIAVERQEDGAELHSFYRDGKLLQQVQLGLDGTQSTLNFENGKLKSSKTDPAGSQNQVVLFWDAARIKPRLKIHMLGARLASWEYFAENGKLAHSGQALSDGSLEFNYTDKGQLRCRQVWQLVGEDWERSYYGLYYSEKFADDGKTIEHKVWVRSNGSLKRHERYNGKSGILEMRREFDQEGRTSRVEEFNSDGSSKQIWSSAPGSRSRGFVPDGMRAYPGEDEKLGSVYDLDGKPFRHSVLDPHPWAFLNVNLH